MGRLSTAKDRERMAHWAKKNRHRVRSNQFRARYGVDASWRERKLKEQDYRCAICRRSIIQTGNYTTGPVIDHDHQTQKARELLCWHCNVGLGGFGDNVETLEAAIGYLRKHKW